MSLFSWFFGPPTRDGFAKALMAALRRAGESAQHTYDQENFRLLTPGSTNVINLATLYKEHCERPRNDRRAHLARVADGLLSYKEDFPDTFEEARPNLRPKILMRWTIEKLNLKRRIDDEKGISFPTYPLGSHLLTTIYYDLPNSMKSVAQDELDKWGVSYYEALEAACDSLAEQPLSYSAIGESVYMPIAGDSYDSSRLLLKDQIAQYQVQGTPVATASHRDGLYVTGSDDAVGLGIVVELAEKDAQNEARPLSPLPLHYVDGEWDDWTVPADHPLHERFRVLEMQFLGPMYFEQKELLDSLAERGKSMRLSLL